MMNARVQTIILAVLAVAAIAYWTSGVIRQSAVNGDIRLTDQDAYIAFAIKAKESGFTYTGERNRMPLYPFLQAVFYKEGMTTKAFFARGKIVNAAMTLGLLIVVFFLFSVYLPKFDALLVTLIAGFTVFAYKAPYFQADVLYYVLAFVAFVLCLECVIRPRWHVGAVAGSVAALAHLTKASVPPLVVLTMACLAVHALLDVIGTVRSPNDKAVRNSAFRSTTTMIAFAGSFLIVLSPYLVESKARHGQYFFNVNSSSYVWADSWQDAKERTIAHDDSEGWIAIPVDGISNARRYFESHTFTDVYERISYGLNKHYANLVHYRVAEYFLVYVIGLLLIGLLNTGWVLNSIVANRAWLALIFVTVYFAGYTMLYSFYAAIASGPRFILSLVLPAIFVCASLTCEKNLAALPWKWTSRYLSPTTTTRWVSLLLILFLSLTLAWELWYRFPSQIGTFHSSE